MTVAQHVTDFAVWLDEDMTLTPVETRIVRALGLRLGSWLPSALLAEAVYRNLHHPELIAAERASLRTHIWRTRRKLVSSPWQIESRVTHGLYRLVARA